MRQEQVFISKIESSFKHFSNILKPPKSIQESHESPLLQVKQFGRHGEQEYVSIAKVSKNSPSGHTGYTIGRQRGGILATGLHTVHS